MIISFIKKFAKNYRLERFLKRNAAFLSIESRRSLLPSASFDFRVPHKGIAVTIKEESTIGCKFVFESEAGSISVGKRSYVGTGTTIICRNKVEIGDDVTISWGCWIYDHNSHSLNWKDRVDDLATYRANLFGGSVRDKNWETVKTAPIKICDKVWIGFNCIILKGVTIGEGAVVGAGAVVTKDVPPWTVVGGNPAVVLKHLDDNRE